MNGMEKTLFAIHDQAVSDLAVYVHIVQCTGLNEEHLIAQLLHSLQQFCY